MGTGDGPGEDRSDVAADPPESVWAIMGALRFVLALIVFGAHAGGAVGLPLWALCFSHIGADAAVLAFFVVSGYSIAHSLRRGARGFYGRRIDRIYPLYLWSMVLSALPFLVWGQTVTTDVNSYQAPATIWPFVGSFVFLQTILFPPLETNHAAWSLSLEVTYYALAPLFARAGSRMLVFFIALSSVLYLWHGTLGAWDLAVPRNHLSFPFLLWSWLGGFWFYRHRGSLRAQMALLLVGVGLLCSYDSTSGKYAAFVLAGSLVLIGQVHTLRAPSAPWRRLGDYLGNLSYPLYILHMPLLVLFGSCWRGHGFLVCLAVFGAVAASYHGVDAPYQRYARRRSGGGRSERPAETPFAPSVSAGTASGHPHPPRSL